VLRPGTRCLRATLRSTCQERARDANLEASQAREQDQMTRVLMEQGMTPEDAIGLIHEKRSGSLSDEYAAWLMTESALTGTHEDVGEYAPRSGTEGCS
jgi:hypothetical protein